MAPDRIMGTGDILPMSMRMDIAGTILMRTRPMTIEEGIPTILTQPAMAWEVTTTARQNGIRR